MHTNGYIIHGGGNKLKWCTKYIYFGYYCELLWDSKPSELLVLNINIGIINFGYYLGYIREKKRKKCTMD